MRDVESKHDRSNGLEKILIQILITFLMLCIDASKVQTDLEPSPPGIDSSRIMVLFLHSETIFLYEYPSTFRGFESHVSLNVYIAQSYYFNQAHNNISLLSLENT